MIEKEKIQNIFKNIIVLINKNNNLVLNSLRKTNKQIQSKYLTLSDHISDIYSKFPNYQLKANLDKDQFDDLFEEKKRKFEEETRNLNKLKDQFEFIVSQNKLDVEKRNSLIKDILFMIEDL